MEVSTINQLKRRFEGQIMTLFNFRRYVDRILLIDHYETIEPFNDRQKLRTRFMVGSIHQIIYITNWSTPDENGKSTESGCLFEIEIDADDYPDVIDVVIKIIKVKKYSKDILGIIDEVMKK